MKNILVVASLLLSSSVFASNYEKLGDWSVRKEENKLTDQTDYYAILPATDRDVSLVLRCQNNKTEAYLSMKDYMGGGHGSKVTLRLDKGKPIVQTWGMGERGTSLFAPKSLQLIQSLVGKKNMIVGYEPYGKSQTIAEFNIDNIDVIATSISSACNWKM
ncbi:type VI secretion system-associated protein TagO [Xenorhabdus sp. XENO-10]|uniref:Type VI secretion system-associated protein TagO n=1 Tax=Xenorhabdus yunnanensis TaxID=3025878 RepID=A0ABT5LBP6_9GAMM|nr:type VI secretion system-associated protein TagO [Xenorhabdus yunnanensis]MDC9588354.1 type VI secretion system-associated protein TagO [Xenorhabdus yunnanensis]